MKQLPAEYMRIPIVAWVVVMRDTHRCNSYQNRDGRTINSQRNVTTVESIGVTPCPFDDYDCEDVEWDEDPRTHYQGEVKPSITTIPATPGTFKILQEDDKGSMRDFCYEIGGVFTNHELNELMNGEG